MAKLRAILASAFLLLPAVSTGGCGSDDFLGTPLEGRANIQTTDVDPTCAEPSTFTKVDDPSSLPECAPACGGAHCVDGEKLSKRLKDAFAKCATGYCIPDTLTKTGGAKPAACTSIGGAEGACLSVCMRQVAGYKDALPQASCAPDERCAPCVSPLDKKRSGACDIGVPAAECDAGPSEPVGPAPCPHMGAPVIDPTILPPCGPAGSGAHCLSSSLVPDALRAQLATCATGLCVPDVLIASGGRYIAPTCTSVAGNEGRCTNTIIPSVAKQADRLPQSTCAANERCVPCASPVDGTPTGACKVSCDPGPTKPTVLFADCCPLSGAPRGKCAPKASIPVSLQERLGAKTCNAATELCVPTENLLGTTPAACVHDQLIGPDIPGVCLSNCLEFGISGVLLSQGICDGNHTCAPCLHPITNQPTGAPGCAP